MKFTEKDKKDWESGEIDYISDEPEDSNGFTTYHCATYYEEEQVTIFTDRFFEGYFHDGMVDSFAGICKGRCSWDDIVDYFELEEYEGAWYTYDDDDDYDEDEDEDEDDLEEE